jgi:hypothetical protein
LKRGPRHTAKFLGVTRLAIDGAHLLRQHDALDGKPWWNQNFEVIPRALSAAPMGRDGADHGKA